MYSKLWILYFVNHLKRKKSKKLIILEIKFHNDENIFLCIRHKGEFFGMATLLSILLENILTGKIPGRGVIRSGEG